MPRKTLLQAHQHFIIASVLKPLKLLFSTNPSNAFKNCMLIADEKELKSRCVQVWKLFCLAPAGWIQDRLRGDKNLDHFTPRAHHHIARGASFGGGAGVKSVQRPKLEIKRTRKRGSGRETLRDHRVPNILSPRSARKTHLQERLAILGVGHAVGPGREALVSAPHDGLQVVWRQHDHRVERVVAHQAAQVLDVVRPETRTTPNITFFFVLTGIIKWEALLANAFDLR